MARKHTNLHTATTLSGGINASVTTIPLTSTTGLPVTYPYDLILEIGTAQIEIVSVTASAGGNNLTVVRGEDGTTAQSHNAGATVVHGVVARDVQEPLDHIDASTNVHGLSGGAAVVGTTQAQTLTNKTISGASNTLSAIPNSALVAIDAAKVTQPFTSLSTGTLATTGNATVGGTLGITGTTTAAVVNATNVTASGTLGVTGNATVGGTLGVTGATTMAAASCTTLAASSNATVGGTLGVTGTSTLGVVNSGNHAITGTLTVSSTAAITGNTTVGGTLGITGATTAAAVTGTTINGTTDMQAAGVSLPRGYIGASTSTTEVTTDTTEVVYLTHTFTAVAGRRYKVTFEGTYTGLAHNDIVRFQIKYQSGASLTAGGSTSIRSVSPSVGNPSPPSGGIWIPLCFSGTTTALSGQYTVGVTFNRVGAGSTVYSTANSNNVARIEVMDVGT